VGARVRWEDVEWEDGIGVGEARESGREEIGEGAAF
jgi:hypothetical protein